MAAKQTKVQIPPPTSLEPDVMWKNLEKGLEQIMESETGNMDMQTYIGLYTTIHNYCTSQKSIPKGSRHKTVLGGELYDRFNDYLVQYLATIRNECQELNGESLLKYFVFQWAKYRRTSLYISSLFRYLERHWILDQENRKKNVYRMLKLQLLGWKTEMFDFLHKAALDAVLELTRKQRNGEWVGFSEIRQFIHSFISLGQETEEDSDLELLLYKSRFEEPFCQATTEYYSKEAAAFLTHHNILDYMKWAEDRIQEEELRANLYLLSELVGPLTHACNDALITKHVDQIRDEFLPFLENGAKDDLARMYRLLSRVANGVDPLLSQFEAYLRNSGLRSVNNLVDDSGAFDSTVYVNTLCNIIASSSCLVSEAFENNPAFRRSWATACREFVNRNDASKSDSKKAAEFIATYISERLSRKCTSSRTDEEVKDIIRWAVPILKHIEDKDIFQRFYTRMLAKRLLSANSPSTDIEACLITGFREVCDTRFTSALQHMIQDLQVSQELQGSYKVWQHENSVAVVSTDDCDESYRIFCSTFWPLAAPSTSFTPPKQILDRCVEFENFYIQKHAGRRLTWLWSPSKGELKANYLRGPGKMPYRFQVSAFQMAILLLFNEKQQISYTEIASNTSLESRILDPCLGSLVRAKVLIAQLNDGNSNNRSEYELNYDFKHRSCRVPLHIVIKSEKSKEIERAYRAQADERRVVIQCAIIRVMKSRKRMKYTELIAETIQQIQARFSPTFADIKKYIEVLLEKEYLERLSDDEVGYLA